MVCLWGQEGPRQLAKGFSNRIAHLPGVPILLEFLRGEITFLSLIHYETDCKIHMDFKYKLQIFKEILAYSWPFWATTSSHPPPAHIHMRVFSWHN